MLRFSKKMEKRVLKVYGSSLTWFLNHKLVGIAVWVSCLVGTVLAFMAVPKTFLPLGDSGLIFGIFISDESTSPNRIQSYQAKVNEILREDPGIANSLSATGLDSMFSPNQGVVFVTLKPVGERAPILTIANRLKERIRNEVPGIIPLFSPQPALKISTGATSTNQGNYAYSVSGIDAKAVYESVPKLEARLKTLKGFRAVSSDLYLNNAQLDIEIDRDLAYSMGVSAASIEELLKNSYSENYVYKIKAPVEQYQVIVEAKKDERADAENLNRLYLNSSNGPALVPFRTVASWKETVGPLSVNHINALPSGTIYFDLEDGYAIGDATTELEKAAHELIPGGLVKKVQGTAQAFTDIEKSAGALILIAIFIMFVILATLYESYMHPITVLSALPVATVGGLLTLLLFGEQFSLYAFVGLFMLMGLAVKNGIMLVDFAIQRQAEGRPPVEAVHLGCIERFRPIIMTTLAAIFGALPIAMGWGANGSMRVPLGLVVVGGLIVSQAVTLYVTPVIYLYFDGIQRKYLDRVHFLARGMSDE